MAEYARRPAGNAKVNALLTDAHSTGAAEYRSPEAPDDVPPPWAQSIMASHQKIVAALGHGLPQDVVAAVQPPPNGGRPVAPRGRREQRTGPGSLDRSGSSSTGSNRAIRLSVKFKGCWHCGKEGHSRTPNARLKLAGCPEFEALKKANGGKLPADYKGAYEKAIDAARAKAGKPPVVRKQVHMLADDDSWEESDLESTDGLFVLGAAPPITGDRYVHQNKFEALDDGEDDSEPDIVTKLSNWAGPSKVTVVKKNQPIKRTVKSHTTIATIEDLERAVRSNPRFGTIPSSTKKLNRALRRSAASIELEDDEILALIDTGATVHAADPEVHFPDYAPLVTPTASSKKGEGALTAGGHLLKNGGKFTVHATADDQDVSIPFYAMKVQMPILAPKKMMKKGTRMLIAEDGGILYNSRTKQQMSFIEHGGLWFLKLKVKKPPSTQQNEEESGFARRG